MTSIAETIQAAKLATDVMVIFENIIEYHIKKPHTARACLAIVQAESEGEETELILALLRDLLRQTENELENAFEKYKDERKDDD